MDNSAQTILLIDDDAQFRGYMSELLKDEGYAIYRADSYRDVEENCFGDTPAWIPDIILLDVKMPAMNGYELCKKIKANANTAEIPVIFVSGLSTLEEKLLGYEVGADDYVAKPIEPSELLAKIQVCLHAATMSNSLKSELANTHSVAFEAMKSSSYLGATLNFLKCSFTCRNYRELGSALLEATDGFGLNASLQIRGTSGVIDMACDGKVKQLEGALLTQAQQKGKIFDFGCRSIFNEDHISILIKNMPIDDSNRYGAFKDNLCMLIDGAEARIKGIEAELALARNRDQLKETVDRMRNILAQIEESNNTLRRESTEIVERIMLDLQLEFATLDLFEDQENRIMEKIQEGIGKSNAVYQKGIRTEIFFKELIDGLTQRITESP